MLQDRGQRFQFAFVIELRGGLCRGGQNFALLIFEFVRQTQKKHAAKQQSHPTGPAFGFIFGLYWIWHK
jgi:hypothetical protein